MSWFTVCPGYTPDPEALTSETLPFVPRPDVTWPVDHASTITITHWVHRGDVHDQRNPKGPKNNNRYTLVVLWLIE